MLEINLHEILDSLDFGVIILDADGIIRETNQKCLEWCLLNKKINVMNKSLRELIVKSYFIDIYNDKSFIYNTKSVRGYTLLIINTQIGSLNDYVKNKNENENKVIAFSKKMTSIVNFAIKIAQTDTAVLITGESGVGKDLLARFIHNLSRRKNEPFVEINCAAIPENLFETELFGYSAGSFSGANTKGKKGLIEESNKGTLFLNEIGELPLNMQAKLLGVLQQKQFVKVGSTKPTKIDVRIIAATNKDLKKMIEEKKFREDLYYRLDVLSINIPPLRERKEDIEPLVLYIIDKLNEKYGSNKIITSDMISYLRNLPWKGNVRELENYLERIYLSINSNKLTKKNCINPGIKNNDNHSLKKLHTDFEKEMFIKALSMCKTTRQLAKYLGISQATVVRKLKKYNLK